MFADSPHDSEPGSPSDLDADAARAQRMHERTGEIELLISGALVFGLFQIPGFLTEVVGGLTPRLSEGAFLTVYMLSFYVRMIVLTLLVSFLLHLVTRAYWVGLIGLDSVFPDGIHWDRIKYGPLAKTVYQERVPRLPLMARRADDVGSSIFSFAFWISLLFVWSIVFAAVVGGLWWLVTATLLPGLHGVWFFVVVFALTMAPTVAIGLDKAFSSRMDPDGTPARAIRAVVTGAYWVTAGPIFMPIQFTLFSRVPKKAMWPLFVGVFATLMVSFFVVDGWTAGTFRLSASATYPVRPGPRTILQDHYADSRDPNAQVPFVQSPVIEGPYVELVVPLIAVRLDSRMEAACPDFQVGGVKGLIGGIERAEPADVGYERRLLACLGRIWTVTLDGAPQALEWDFHWNADFGPVAVVAYLPTAEMAPGAHSLEVSEIARPYTDKERAAQEAAGEDPPGPSIDYIRFRN